MCTELTVIRNKSCQRQGFKHILDSHLCFSTLNLRSTAVGDSGGPLILKSSGSEYIQIGLVSYGTANGYENGKPVVCTRISSYIDWIEKIRHTKLSNDILCN